MFILLSFECMKIILFNKQETITGIIWRTRKYLILEYQWNVSDWQSLEKSKTEKCWDDKENSIVDHKSIAFSFGRVIGTVYVGETYTYAYGSPMNEYKIGSRYTTNTSVEWGALVEPAHWHAAGSSWPLPLRIGTRSTWRVSMLETVT